jgi:hypothetical protein
MGLDLMGFLHIRICKLFEIYDSSCISFAFQTAICGPLERTGLFIWPISYFVTCIVFFSMFGSIVEESTNFQYFNHL